MKSYNPMAQKPEKAGVYEIDNPYGYVKVVYSMWTGEMWLMSGRTVEEAKKVYHKAKSICAYDGWFQGWKEIDNYERSNLP